MSKKQIPIPFFIPHQGCPRRCAFCAQWKTSGAVKLPAPEDIPGTVARYRESAPATVTRFETAFFGGSFTGLRRDLQAAYLEQARAIKQQGLLHAIRLSTRPDYIDKEIISFLREFSVDTVELGAQSFHDEILERANRGHNAADTFRASELIKKAGLNLVIQLMPGLPGDSRERSLASAKKALALEPAAVRLYPTVVLAGTELEKMMNKGSFTPLSLEQAVEWSADQFTLFHEADIPVIRIGLHPVTPEEEHQVVAGPYSTSLGFQVRSRYRRRLLEGTLEKAPDLSSAEALCITVPEKLLPEYIGHRRDNIRYLEKKFTLAKLRIHPSKERDISLSTADHWR